MKRITGEGLLLLTILLIGVVSITSASANSSQDTLSTGEIFDFNDSNSQRMPLPDFGPQTLEDLKNEPDVLAIKGQIPRYATQAERQNWLGKLDDIRVEVEDDLRPYAYPKGPVIAHGFGENGYVEVYLYRGMNVTDSQINEIYNIIDKTGNKVNIRSVPVVFFKSDFWQDAIEIEAEDAVEETLNLSTSEENLTELNGSRNNGSGLLNESGSNLNSSNKSKSNKKNSTPGFELLGSLACLYVGCKLRRR